MKMITAMEWRACLLAAVSGLALLAPAQALAQAASVTLTVIGNADVIWGTASPPQLQVQLTVQSPCPTPVANTVRIRDNGADLGVLTVPLTCNGSVQSGSATMYYDALRAFGSHYMSAHYPGSGPDIAFASNFVSLREEFRFITFGNVVLTALAAHPTNCPVRTASLQFREQLDVQPPPPNLRMPYEHISYTSSQCSEPSTLFPYRQLARIQLPFLIPPGTEVWVNDYLSSTAERTWRRATGATIDQYGATFEIFGRRISGINDPYIFATAALALPQPPARTLDLQDLWWGGGEQSGWGLNIAKNDEKMFVSLFIYESDGRPLWVVMPEGMWDPVHEVYWGLMYIPSGSFHGSYDAKKFRMGEAVGTGSLSFPTLDDARFDYQIRGLAGGKNISRYVFAKRNPEVAPTHSGMWWGGAGQEGWGVSIQEQGPSLFATWYTYGADGAPVWFYMSGGSWTNATTFTGDLNRTTGTSWLGTQYSSSSTRNFRVGTMTLNFSNRDNATMTTTVDGLTQTRPITRFGF